MAAIEIVSKSIPAFVDVISSLAGSAIGTSIVAGGGGSKAGSGKQPLDPANPPSRDGLRRRRPAGSLVELSEFEVKQINRGSERVVEIQQGPRLDQLDRLPFSAIRSDSIGEILTDLSEVDFGDLSDVDLDNDDSTPLIPPDSPPPRRRNFLKRFLVGSGIGTIPIGGATIAILLTQDRSSAVATIVDKSRKNDCPDGPDFTFGYAASVNGLDVCNYRKIFTYCLTFLLGVLHNNKPISDVYFNFIFDDLIDDADVKLYFRIYDTHLKKPIQQPATESQIYAAIIENLNGNSADLFVVKVRQTDQKFIDKWFQIDPLLTKLVTADPEFGFFWKTVNLSWSLLMSNVEKTLDKKNDWPWSLANRLADANGDMKVFMTTPQYVLWKEQVRQQFLLASTNLIFWLFQQIDGRQTKVYNKTTHPSISSALVSVGSPIGHDFINRFCTEFFSNDFDKCLGQLEIIFDPKTDTGTPPFFDKKVKVNRVEQKDGDNIGVLGINSVISQLISSSKTTTDPNSTTTPLPGLEQNKYEIFEQGVVVKDSKSTFVFFLNPNSKYIGVLQITGKDLKVGYVKWKPDSMAPYYPENRQSYADACLYLTPFQPFVKKSIEKALVPVDDSNSQTYIPFDLNMEIRESYSLYSLFLFQKKMASGILNSANLIAAKTGQSVVSMYKYAEDTVSYLYYTGAGAVKSVLNGGFYILLGGLGLIFISLVGPGLKETVSGGNKRRKVE